MSSFTETAQTGSSQHPGLDWGSLEGTEVLTLRMGRGGYGIGEFCVLRTKLDEATDHVLRGCTRLFHGRSFSFEVNSGGSEEIILGEMAYIYATMAMCPIHTVSILIASMDLVSSPVTVLLGWAKSKNRFPRPSVDATNRTPTTSPMNRGCGIGCARRSGERRGQSIGRPLIAADKLYFNHHCQGFQSGVFACCLFCEGEDEECGSWFWRKVVHRFGAIALERATWR